MVGFLLVNQRLGEDGVTGEDDGDGDDVEEGRGQPPHHPVRFALEDPHRELVGGTDPDEVEVCEDPGETEGQTPGDHDAQVGESQHGEDGEGDGADLEKTNVSV